jgi:hypothetical protein
MGAAETRSVIIVNAFTIDLDSQFQRITAMHPQLLDAVPPEPIECRPGTYGLKVAEFWGEFCNREWQPRPGNDANLVGPFRCYGDCLAPFTQENELHWYDSRLAARDGDVVLVQWQPEVLQNMYERNGADADWLAQYGAQPNPIATKVLKAVGDQHYLLTRKSALPLGGNRILGVLRRRVRDGSSDFPVSNLIEPNAATDPYSATASGPVNVVLTAPSTLALDRVLYVSFTIFEPTTVEVSGMCRLGVSGSGHTVKTSAYYGSVSTPVIAADQITEKTDNAYGNLSMIGTFNIPAAGTYRAGLTCAINGDGVNNVTAIYRDISVRVMAIKR